MPATIDEQMETASQALAELDYARCESLCVDALRQARDASDWVTYQRVLLPLQEARRQRRQAALDGPILLGTPGAQADVASQIKEIEQGCVVLTWPCTSADAQALNAAVHETKWSIELLFADNASDADIWRLTSTAGPGLSTDIPAPKAEWIGQWVGPAAIAPPTPAHWFMQASEALGNTALAAIEYEPGSIEYLQSLEQALACVDDHEILHQRLASAAQALHETKR
ncbi:MAG: hypothetical protein KTR15_00350 [Phycisphaeraceae bacterium]|nr:hypothetical protein [Phycisphaeraceae bacterium]